MTSTAQNEESHSPSWTPISTSMARCKIQIQSSFKILIIETPKKIWISRVKNQYIPLYYSDGINNSLFDYNCCGKSGI